MSRISSGPITEAYIFIVMRERESLVVVPGREETNRAGGDPRRHVLAVLAGSSCRAFPCEPVVSWCV